jgi:hypothetical protein
VIDCGDAAFVVQFVHAALPDEEKGGRIAQRLGYSSMDTGQLLF